MKTVYFVRHGETVSNISDIVQGLDDPLSEKGEKQALQLAERAKQLNFDSLISSDAVRARDTAEEIAKVKRISLTTTELLREVKQPSSLIGTEHRSEDGFIAFQLEREKNILNRDWHYEDEENYFDVLERVKRAIYYIEDLESESIFVVTHGGFLRYASLYLVLNKKLSLDLWFSNGFSVMENTGISKFVYSDNVWKLKHWNDIAHFAE